MKNKAIKILCLLTVLVLLCGTFAACKGKQTTGETTTQAPEVTKEPSLLDTHAPQKDLDGRDFNILTPVGYNDVHYFATHNESATSIELSCFQRTLLMEERYNVTLKTIEVEKPYEMIMNTGMGDASAYDLVFPHPKTGIVTLATSGYLVDMLTLDELDFSQDWWVKGMSTDYKINGHLYYVSSDAAVVSHGLGSLIYNKDLYKSYGYEDDLYKTVYDQKWTAEAFKNIIVETASTNEGTATSKTYAFIHHNSHTYVMSQAMGLHIIEKNDAGELTIGMTKEKALNVANKIYDIFYTEEDSVYRGSASTNAVLGSSEIWLRFSSGHGIFMTFDVGQTYNLLRELEFEVGYLPLPKYDETQKDYFLFCGSGLFAIPTAAVNVNDSALLFNAFSIYSSEHVKPAFFEIIVGGRLSSAQVENYEMLLFLHSKKSFDVGFTLDEEGGVFNVVHKVVFENEDPDQIGRILQQQSKLLNNILKMAKGESE